MDELDRRRLSLASWSSALVMALCLLLLVSGTWNFWQYRLIKQQQRQQQEQHAAAAMLEAVATQAESEFAKSHRRKNASDAEADAQIGKLYQEINALTRLSEQVILRDQSLQRTAAKGESQVK